MKPFREKAERESKAERDHAPIARRAGWFVEKIMRTARNGFPDRFYASAHPKHRCRTCNRARVVLIEWKSKKGVLSPQQELRIAQLRQVGVEVHVVSSIVEANRILGIGDERESEDL